jgi:L-alanine-DL-glutamate epimerase-like enolase superfamily enzyme
VGDGWPALKFGWLPRSGDADSDLALVQAARKGAGPRAELMIDVGSGWERRDGTPRALRAWDHRTAARRIRTWEEADLAWVEEPLPADDLDGYRRLVEAVETPIAAGEQETTRFAIQTLMDHGGIDVVQPDVGRVGGPTEARRVSQAAADRHRRFAPHSYGSPIQFIASAHVAAAAPTLARLEYPLLLEHAPALVHPSPRPRDGVFTVSDAPGLGIDLDEELVAHLRVPIAQNR